MEQNVELSSFIKERNNYSTTLLHGEEYIGYTLLLEYLERNLCYSGVGTRLLRPGFFFTALLTNWVETLLFCVSYIGISLVLSIGIYSNSTTPFYSVLEQNFGVELFYSRSRTYAEKLIPFHWSRGAFLYFDLFHRLKIPATFKKGLVIENLILVYVVVSLQH